MYIFTFETGYPFTISDAVKTPLPVYMLMVCFWFVMLLSTCCSAMKFPVAMSTISIEMFLVLSALLIKATGTVTHNHGINLWLVTVLAQEFLCYGFNKRLIKIVFHQIYSAAAKTAAHDT